MIEILNTHALVTVQDLGRNGHYRQGVGRSGAMDRLALAIGNALLGNPLDAAGLEVPVQPFRLRFAADLSFAVTGADCEPTLDGTALPPDWAAHARAGQVLALQPARSGCRAYVSFHGGIDVPPVLGSRSTQLREGFGGLDGRMLKSGDLLRAAGGDAGLPPGGLGADRTAGFVQMAPADDGIAVRVLPAGEYSRFSNDALAKFWQSPWKISPQSNRTGYRLVGPELDFKATPELRSHGIVPGVIQVPPGGQPIIQLADAATMGGYAKIGTVIEADLWRLGQARPGDTVRFLETSYDDAVTALEEIDAYLAGLRQAADLQRSVHTERMP